MTTSLAAGYSVLKFVSKICKIVGASKSFRTDLHHSVPISFKVKGTVMVFSVVTGVLIVIVGGVISNVVKVPILVFMVVTVDMKQHMLPQIGITGKLMNLWATEVWAAPF